MADKSQWDSATFKQRENLLRRANMPFEDYLKEAAGQEWQDTDGTKVKFGQHPHHDVQHLCDQWCASVEHCMNDLGMDLPDTVKDSYTNLQATRRKQGLRPYAETLVKHYADHIGTRIREMAGMKGKSGTSEGAKKGWEHRRITVTNGERNNKIDADVYDNGEWAVHRDILDADTGRLSTEESYSVTHIPTGSAIDRVLSKTHARNLARTLHDSGIKLGGTINGNEKYDYDKVKQIKDLHYKWLRGGNKYLLLPKKPEGELISRSGTSEGARKGWQSRQRGMRNYPTGLSVISQHDTTHYIPQKNPHEAYMNHLKQLSPRLKEFPNNGSVDSSQAYFMHEVGQHSSGATTYSVATIGKRSGLSRYTNKFVYVTPDTYGKIHEQYAQQAASRGQKLGEHGSRHFWMRA